MCSNPAGLGSLPRYKLSSHFFSAHLLCCDNDSNHMPSDEHPPKFHALPLDW